MNDITSPSSQATDLFCSSKRKQRARIVASSRLNSRCDSAVGKNEVGPSDFFQAGAELSAGVCVLSYGLTWEKLNVSYLIVHDCRFRRGRVYSFTGKNYGNLVERPMATATLRRKPRTRQPETHELLDFLDRQGSFSEKEYLALTDNTNRLVEFTDGFLEILPMPTDYHQVLLRFAFLAFHGFVTPLGGTVQFAALRLRIRKGKFREPDLLLLISATDPRRQNRFWTGADLVLEVVSEDKPERDLVIKRRDYAAAGIPEYWIINPITEQILVLGLSKKHYRSLGKYGRGDLAKSSLLAGFQINVDEVFDAK